MQTILTARSQILTEFWDCDHRGGAGLRRKLAVTGLSAFGLLGGEVDTDLAFASSGQYELWFDT
jgi:hypothetical protein